RRECGSRFRRAGGCDLRVDTEPPQRILFLARRTHPGRILLGFVLVSSERSRICAHRAAVASDTHRHSRTRPESAHPGWRNLQRPIDPAAPFLELPRRLLRLVSAHEAPPSERAEAPGAGDFRRRLDWNAGGGLPPRPPCAACGGG